MAWRGHSNRVAAVVAGGHRPVDVEGSQPCRMAAGRGGGACAVGRTADLEAGRAAKASRRGPAEDDAEQAKFRERLAVAEALFKKRCETAGEFIYKTVPDVKGVVWMKWRDGSGESDGSHQYGLYDPYGRDCGDESCMGDLLKATEGRHFASETNVPIGTGEYGYDYVETTDPKDGRHYRYAMRYYRPADRPASGGVKWLQNAARAELHKTEIDRSPLATASRGTTSRFARTVRTGLRAVRSASSTSRQTRSSLGGWAT